MAEHEASRRQYAQLQQQNRQLAEANAQAERGDNVELKARDYFGMGFPNETRVVADVAAAATPAPAQRIDSGPPYWLEWIRRLTQP